MNRKYEWYASLDVLMFFLSMVHIKGTMPKILFGGYFIIGTVINIKRQKAIECGVKP